MEVRTLGIDLAKNLFHVHGVDGQGRTVVQRQLRRRQLLPFVAQLQPCLVAMKACGGAHYWAREMAKRGHEVRLMSPRFGLTLLSFVRRLDPHRENLPEALLTAEFT